MPKKSKLRKTTHSSKIQNRKTGTRPAPYDYLSEIIIFSICLVIFFCTLLISPKNKSDVTDFMHRNFKPPDLLQRGQRPVVGQNMAARLDSSENITHYLATDSDIEYFYPRPIRNYTQNLLKIQDNLYRVENFCKDSIATGAKDIDQDPNSQKVTNSAHYFQNMDKQQELLLRLYNSNMTDELRLISETTNNYLLCEIPKAGTTNWKKIILKANLPDIYGQKKLKDIIRPHAQLYGGDNPNDPAYKEGYHYLFDTKGLSNVYKLFSNSRKVIFTRHPFDRLLSAFRDKVLPHVLENQLYSNIVKTLKRANKKSELHKLAAGAFHEFVEYLILSQRVKNGEFSGYGKMQNAVFADPNTGARTRHWSSMSEICSVCSIKWDFIGKLETFEDDFSTLLGWLGQMKNNKLEGASSNGNLHELYQILQDPAIIISNDEKKKRITRLKFYYKNLPKESVRNLYDIYRQDFELFGYEFPDFLL